MHVCKQNILIKDNVSTVHSKVLAIENYPKFLPYCHSTKILSKDLANKKLLAEMTVKYLAFKHSYISQVHWCDRTITAIAEQGLFNHLTTNWRFNPNQEQPNYTDVNFVCRFEFRSPLLQKLATKAFADLNIKMVEAFKNWQPLL